MTYLESVKLFAIVCSCDLYNVITPKNSKKACKGIIEMAESYSSRLEILSSHKFSLYIHFQDGGWGDCSLRLCVVITLCDPVTSPALTSKRSLPWKDVVLTVGLATGE